jgi:ribosomal protein S11
MTHYRAVRQSILDETGKQIAVVLASGCTKKLASEMAAYAAQQATHAAKRKELEKQRKDQS